MPWGPSDALHFTKLATTPGLQRLWAQTANRVRALTSDKGQAVRIANDAVKRQALAGGRRIADHNQAAAQRGRLF